jgi:hypothetical protein
VQPGTLNVGSKGEKFFLSPSLSTQAGSLVAREQKSKRTKSIVIGASIQTVLIHTETLETLKLRQVPIPQVSRWWYRKVSSHMRMWWSIPQGLMAQFFALQGAQNSGAAALAAGGAAAAAAGVKRQRTAPAAAASPSDAICIHDDDDDDDDGGIVDLTAPEA